MLASLLPLLALSSLSLVSARTLPLRMVAERNMMAEATTTAAPMAMETAAKAMMPEEKTTMAAEATKEKMAMEEPAKTTMMAHEGAKTTEAAMMAHETTTTMMHEAAATATAVYVPPAAMTAAPAMYGSGSMKNDGYNACIQQCQAQFGMGAPGTPPPPPEKTGGAEAGKGTKTHTVIVAPTQGVLKFVPFALDAAVGDEIVYKWGANVHTVTKGSGGALCNASKAEGFTSGRQNNTFEFKKTVNDTNPLWVFCGVPTHCQKGMFAGVNIKKVTPSAQNATGAFEAAMTTLAGKDAKVMSMMTEAKAYVGNNTAAWSWGATFDMAGMEDWAVPVFMENVLTQRMVLKANLGMLAGDEPSLDTMVSPPRLNATIQAATAGPPATVSVGAGAEATGTAVAAGSVATGAAGTAEALNSGASSLARPVGLLLLVALPVMHFLL